MHTTTLRGIFPDPKPVSRRNFIKENVKSIKQMQNLLQEAGVIQPRATRADKYQNVPPLLKSRDITPSRHHSSSTDNTKAHHLTKQPLKKPPAANQKAKQDQVQRTKAKSTLEVNDRFTSRAIQTERTDDLNRLYETGVIKYPSPGLGRSDESTKHSPTRVKSYGDTIENDMQSLDLEEKDYIKKNMTNLQPKQLKPAASKVPAQAPPSYQRGVVPKYLRDRKQDEQPDHSDEPCPEGHVLLPEEERKETLRVLRQSKLNNYQKNSNLQKCDIFRHTSHTKQKYEKKLL
ncbi:unnamed protein product [Acanthoscelides obtectus]|uniref:Enkurin domain-containing protein n=1 Tax=Acanthoscelides obtectus TaxID=200917 RepID=A0A9P0PX84_ACAOB|nr:unnamed protein product [Acanthoscelides obtectus]CAK1679805.1 hypothetical protein AOBTE_LOCUS32436 [Acanthoscelides obtectus]